MEALKRYRIGERIYWYNPKDPDLPSFAEPLDQPKPKAKKKAVKAENKALEPENK